MEESRPIVPIPYPPRPTIKEQAACLDEEPQEIAEMQVPDTQPQQQQQPPPPQYEHQWDPPQQPAALMTVLQWVKAKCAPPRIELALL